MDVDVRPMRDDDLDAVAEVVFTAFFTVGVEHGSDPPFHSVRAARNLCGAYLRYSETRPFVAEQDGRIVGAAFLHPRGRTAGVGPVAVDPTAQGGGVGRKLMERVVQEAGPGASVRLLQAGFNRTSFALYTRTGFCVRDAVSTMVSQGGTLRLPESGAAVTVIGDGGVDAIAAYDQSMTGISRATDLSFLTHVGTTFVAGDPAAPDGFLCRLSDGHAHYLGPGVARDEATLEALLSAALRDLTGQSAVVRVPACQPGIIRSALAWGLRVGGIGTYMVCGSWEPPRGAVLLPTFPESL